jgi:hypothetical protein
MSSVMARSLRPEALVPVQRPAQRGKRELHTHAGRTMNVYGHASLDSQRAALNRLDDLLGE